ncbi:MAG: hypothetical protein ACMUIG_07900 [Thermoplasmatota archaeon]
MGYRMEFQVNDHYLLARAAGPASLEGNVEFAKRLIEKAETSGRKKILIDIRDLTDPTSIFDAYELSEVGASFVRGKSLKIALLHGKEREELESFFETASRNRGINIRVFMEESECMEWLLK